MKSYRFDVLALTADRLEERAMAEATRFFGHTDVCLNWEATATHYSMDAAAGTKRVIGIEASVYAEAYKR